MAAWHPLPGTIKKTVRVAPNGFLSVEFKFKDPVDPRQARETPDRDYFSGSGRGVVWPSLRSS